MARPTKRPPQRSNGLGSVYPHTSGRWCAAVTLEVVKVVQDDGTVKRRTLRKVVFCADRAAAEAALVELRRLQGLDLELTDDPTLALYLKAWIAKRGGSGLRPRTLTTYEMIIDRNLIPVLGPLKLSALTTKRIRAALDRLASGERLDRHGERAKPLGSATVAMCRSVLSNALADAVEDGLISSNPAAQLKRAATSTATPKDRALSDDELRALVAAALKYDRTRPDDEHSAVAPLAALLIMGLRISEALAVRWADVSLGRGVLTVSGNLYRERIPGDGRKDRTYGQPRILRGEPKTARSRRTIALPASILAILAEHHVRQNEHRARVGVWGGSDAVCASPIGTWTDDSAARKRLGLVGNSAGIDNLHPHLLRHSAASMAVQDGAPLAHVSGGARSLQHQHDVLPVCRPTDRIAWRDCPGR